MHRSMYPAFGYWVDGNTCNAAGRKASTSRYAVTTTPSSQATFQNSLCIK